MSEHLLFYVIFFSQVVLVSYYLPGRLLKRMRYVLTAYPPSEYPKLYPQPVEAYQQSHRNYHLFNRVILVIGLLLLVVIIWSFSSSTGKIGEGIPIVYGMLQFVPLFKLELSECGQLKLMRQSNTTRQAELSRRRLFDFVSAKMLIMTVLVFVAALWLDLYWHQFVFSWAQGTVGRMMALIGTNIFFAVLIAWQLYGKKLNPHQANSDRAKQISQSANSAMFCSMAMSVLLMSQAAGDVYDLDALEASLMSLYFQSIVLMSIGGMLRNIKIDKMNFEVYKQ